MSIERKTKKRRITSECPAKTPPGPEDGDKLVIEPAPRKSLLAVLKALRRNDERFPPCDDSPPEPVDL